VSIPDVLPSALPPGSNFSLVAGLFLVSIYIMEIADACEQAISKKYMVQRVRMKMNLRLVAGTPF
jgi:hypothetical protein